MPDPYAVYTPTGDRILAFSHTERRRIEGWLQWVEHLRRALLWR